MIVRVVPIHKGLDLGFGVFLAHGLGLLAADACALLVGHSGHTFMSSLGCHFWLGIWRSTTLHESQVVTARYFSFVGCCLRPCRACPSLSVKLLAETFTSLN